jgi:hypothetical protein
MALFYNDLEFKAEDAIASLFTAPVLALLGAAPVVLSLITDSLTNSHIAIIADDFEPHQDPPRTGNYRGVVRIKTVTNFDEVVPGGFANLRALHRQRCGIVRDTLAVTTLDTDLTDAIADFNVQGFNFGRIHQHIVGRSWVTEWSIILESVCGTDLSD